MDDPQDPLRAFNEDWGVLAWTIPSPVKQMLRTALKQWCQHTCAGSAPPTCASSSR